MELRTGSIFSFRPEIGIHANFFPRVSLKPSQKPTVFDSRRPCARSLCPKYKFLGQRLTRLIAVLLTSALVLSACVTESTGGLPGPAPKEDRVQAQLDLARGYMENRDWMRAKAPLQRALRIDPASVEAHVLFGVLYQAENESALAEEHFTRALRSSPRDPQALMNYGGFLYAQERYEESLAPLELLVEDTVYRGRPQAFESLGLAYLQVEDLAEAEASFRRALELNFRLPRSNLELARLLFDRGDVGGANEHFFLYNRVGRPSARSTCLGLKIAIANKDTDQEARYRLSLKNLFADQAEQCLKTL